MSTASDPVAGDARRRPDVGLQLIVAYKATKAVAEVALSFVVLALASTGRLSGVREFAIGLQHHVASHWVVVVGRGIAELVSQHGLHLVEIGLFLDGILSAIEGFSLAKRYRWGPWLVVVATATPLPLEIAHALRTRRISRLVIVLLNVAVVAYLARRIVRDRATRPPTA